MVNLPASYTQDNLNLIESWSVDNCFRAAIVKKDDHHAVWVAVRERTRSKGDWLRHARGVFSALRLDVRPLTRDRSLALCVEPEALEMIHAASNTTSRAAPKEDDATQDDGTRDMIMPSGRRRAAERGKRTQTSFEIVKAA
jgi:hypothetical protein